MERECSTCKSFQLLKRQLASSEEREREMREKLKELRLELHNASRQLDFAKRKGQALSVEKSALEASAEHDKSTLRKLEHRLAVANGGEAAQAKLAKYRAQMSEMKELLADTAARLQLSEEATQTAEREVQILKSALGLKQDLPDSSLESYGKMLQCLAQSEEESASLALALAAKEEALAEGAAALRAAQAEVERLTGVRVELIHRCEEARQEAGEALELAQVYKREASAAHREAAQLQERLEQALTAQKKTDALLRSTEAALANEQEERRKVIDKLAAAERASKLSTEALESEVSIALERADLRLREVQTEAAARHATLTDQLTQTQAALEAAQASLASSSRHHDDLMADREALLARLRAERGAAEQDASEARREANVLRTQLDSAEEETHRLKGDLSAARSEVLLASEALTRERHEASVLRSRIESVDAKLRHALGEAAQREEALQHEVRELRAQLSGANSVASRLQDELAAARAQAAGATSRRNETEDLRAAVHALTQSKAKLQSGLLDQLSEFREKLSLAEEENRRLRMLHAVESARAAKDAAAPDEDVSPSHKIRTSSQVPLQYAVSAATTAAAAARLSRHPSPAVTRPPAGSLASPHTTPSRSMLGRARLHMRAAEGESESDDDTSGRVKDMTGRKPGRHSAQLLDTLRAGLRP